MATYDVLLKGGTVIDPAVNINTRRDVAITAGRVAAVAPEISPAEARKVFDLTGLIITPGLIDFHLHAYWGGTRIGLDVDHNCLPLGVTTVIDAGSSGAHNFLAFRRLVIENAHSRILCFLNLSTIGLVDTRVGELVRPEYIDPDAITECVNANRDLIIGLKLRMDTVGDNGLRPLQIALDLADKMTMRVMVHIGNTPMPLPAILSLLRRGDVVTHYLTPKSHGILDEEGRILLAVLDARERGVLFDVGQGRLNLGFRVARRALDAGLLPDTISSDLVIDSVSGDKVRSLPDVMSRFLGLGLSLEQVIERTTSNPARLLGCDAKIGSLRPGAVADVAVFAIEEGEFKMLDALNEELIGHERLVPMLVLLAGEVSSA